MTTPAEAGIWLAIAGAETGVEPARLARRAGGCVELVRAPEPLLRRLGVPEEFSQALRAARHRDIGAYLAGLSEQGITCSPFGSEGYPAVLAQLADPPVAVFERGAGPSLDGRGRRVAIVGSRHPTDAGLALTRELAAFTAAAGMPVVSGIALGIDAAAHAGALEGGGTTHAVLGCGVDVIYPRTNSRLFERVLAAGRVISEYPPGVAPAPWRFPARNRLIAALCDTLVVVEARSRSGALITADMALDLGRDVVAVPGAPASKLAAGTNGLIKAGAGLIESCEDLAGWLGVDPPGARTARPDGRLGEVFDVVASAPLDTDMIAARLGLSAAEAAAAITRLELEGWVAADASGRLYPLRRVAG